MSSLERYYLKDNPFALVPSKTNPVWADRDKLKSDLEDSIKFVLYSTPSQIIACIYGDWGGGKTHSMNYFSSEAVLGRIAGEVGIPKDRCLLSIPLIFPMGDVFTSIYLEIVYRHLIPRLGDVLAFLFKQTMPLEREGQLEEKLKNLTLNEDLARVLPQFTTRNRSLFVQKYLSMSASKTDLNKLGVAKGIQTNNEMLVVLSDMLKLFTRTIYSRIFIWIDDCERIGDVPGKSMFEFQWFLRDILDLVPEKLTWIINFTLYPGEEVDERLKYLGPAVQDRIAKLIKVDYLNRESYLKYVEDLLENFRERSTHRSIPQYFPFSEKCLNKIFNMFGESPSNVQPRTINRVLSHLLALGVRDNIQLIDEQYLETVKEDVQKMIIS
jgi:hypothetical protein